MKASFDLAALRYDEAFTYTYIGQAQRHAVWTYLEKQVLTDQSIGILELNAGTGEDALYLASKGNRVLVTDISDEMLSKARMKTDSSNSNLLDFKTLDMSSDKNWPDTTFDLIFSNFGGMNCLSPDKLSKTLTHVQEHVKPNGQFIAVIMPRFCLMESLYFFFTLNWSKMFRRLTSKSVSVNVDGEPVSTWYYSPADFRNSLNTMHFVKGVGIGITVPPSYLEPKMRNFPKLMKLLERMDITLMRWSVCSLISDHVLLHFRKSP